MSMLQYLNRVIKMRFFSGVPFDAEIGRYVTDVKANNHGPSVTYTLDVDGFQIYEPKRELLDTVSGLFNLDSSTASVTTADYLENYRDKYIEFDVKVSEPHSTTVRVCDKLFSSEYQINYFVF